MLNESQVQTVRSELLGLFGVDVTSLPGTQLFRQPRDPEEADAVVVCFKLAQQLGLPVHEVALKLAKALSECGKFKEAEAEKGYVNLKLHENDLYATAFSAAKLELETSIPHRIMVEYLSPNTNKPLHLGHLRNGVLGTSLANVLAAVGHTVTRSILVNDRGAHICKSMLAWQRFVPHETPSTTGTKPDHFVGDCYVRYAQAEKSDPTLSQAVADMLRRWEEGDLQTLKIWETMNAWVYEGFEQTFKDFGFNFDVWYYESSTYILGKDIVMSGLAKGVFEKTSDGAVIYRLDPDLFGQTKDGTEHVQALLRKDGTSLYLTQDLGTAVLKATEHHLDRSIYVVACEQDHHFKSLFDILKKLGYAWADGCYHLSYQMVVLPEGKMKSREGTVVDADTLLEEVSKLVGDEFSLRNKGVVISTEARRHQTKIIALAAIKFYLLLYDPQTQVKFDPRKSVSLTGDTGPYCLYTYVRAKSVLRGAGHQVCDIEHGKLTAPEERDLAKHLVLLRDSVLKSADTYDTSILAKAILDLAKSFNRFYTNRKVLHEPDEQTRLARLALVEVCANSMLKALELLGIEVLEEM